MIRILLGAPCTLSHLILRTSKQLGPTTFVCSDDEQVMKKLNELPTLLKLGTSRVTAEIQECLLLKSLLFTPFIHTDRCLLSVSHISEIVIGPRITRGSLLEDSFRSTMIQ